MQYINLSHSEIFDIATQFSNLEKPSKKGLDGDWQVRRFAQEDWILNVRVYRVFRRRRKFQVALFRSADHEKFVEFSGVMGGLVFLLSEAYNQTGSMAVEFLGPSQANKPTLDTGYEPCIPKCISEYLSHTDICLEKRDQISDQEGRALYLQITGLRPSILAALQSRGIDEIQLCFVIQRNIWTTWQAEHLCIHAYAPEKIFLSKILPEHRLQFLSDLFVLRSVIMAERVQLQLQDERKASEPPKVESFGKCRFSLNSPDVQAEILVCPTTTFDELKGVMQSSVNQSRRMNKNTILTLTADFNNFSDNEKQWVRKFADDQKLFVHTVLDRTADLDAEISFKLKQSSSTSKPPPVKAD